MLCSCSSSFEHPENKVQASFINGETSFGRALLPIRSNVIGSVMVPPSRPSPKTTLYLSNLDDHLIVRRRFDTLLVYNNGSHNISPSPNPVKVIRDALSQVLAYYYPLAGRVRRTHDGLKLQVECTGEGALFAEASTHNTLSLLSELEELQPSFEQLLFQVLLTTEVEEVPPLIFQVNFFLFFCRDSYDFNGSVEIKHDLTKMAAFILEKK